MNYELHHGDCLEVMRTIPDASVDCVLTDPPYGTTACKWDSVIPFEPMWEQLKRIAKPKAAICLFGSQPFTSALVMSNPKMFRYSWVWNKMRGVGFQVARYRPLMQHEDVNVFSVESLAYYPQMDKRAEVKRSRCYTRSESSPLAHNDERVREYLARHPASVLWFSNAARVGKIHPTQKPVELLRYLIRTYTQEGETVLDFTMGSGSTGVACELENRKFIGIEKEENYFNIAKERIEGVRKREPLFMEAAA